MVESVARSIAQLNALTEEALRSALERCCGARAWFTAMLALRPFESQAAVLAASERAFSRLEADDYLEAFSHHPKIGANLEELARRFPSTATLSAGEQAAVAGASAEVVTRLRDANLEYERRFGFIFIVCATGKSAEEMLGLLEARLHNDVATELAIASGEQRKITRLRLEKLLAAPRGAAPLPKVTTHVLDTGLGCPASGVAVVLEQRCADGAYRSLGHASTNADGRVTQWSPAAAGADADSSVFRLVFDVGAYYRSRSERTFFPEVCVVFSVDDATRHHHVPLLLSPFSYSTYRGS